MNNIPSVQETVDVDPQKYIQLLRTPEEEARIAKQTEKWPLYEYKKVADNGASIVVAGDQHFFKVNETAKRVENILSSGQVDSVFVEGSQWEAAVEEVKAGEMTEDQVLEKYGEQPYFAVLAIKYNIPVQSWDVSIQKMLLAAIEQHSLKNVFGWMAAQSAKQVIAQGRPLEEQSIREMSKFALTDRVLLALAAHGYEIDPDTIPFDEIAKDISGGLALSSWTSEFAEKLATPRETGPTNLVIRQMNKARDEHAIQLIAEAKAKKKHILVTCGGSHAVTWEPAIDALYQEESRQ